MTCVDVFEWQSIIRNEWTPESVPIGVSESMVTEGVHEVYDEAEYVVEAVIDKRSVDNKTEYLIQWQGFDDNHNTWERMYCV